MDVQKKTVIRNFSCGHIDSFADYLNEMARKGWHFSGWCNGLVFHKGEPRNDRYAVEIFSQANDQAFLPEPQTQEFAEYCLAAGWDFIDARGKFCVFREALPGAVPILTDAERLENILDIKKRDGLALILLPLVFLSLILIQFILSFEAHIFDFFYVFMGAVLILLAISGIYSLLRNQLWEKAQKQLLEQGQPLRFTQNRRRHLLSIAGSCGLVLAMLFNFLLSADWANAVLIPGVFLSFLCFTRYLNKHRPDVESMSKLRKRFVIQAAAATSLAVIGFGALVTLVLPQPEPPEAPLTLDALTSEAQLLVDQNHTKDTTFFGSRESWELEYKKGTLTYDLYRSEWDWVLDKIWQDTLDEKENLHKDYCTAAWGAEAAYYNGDNRYFVRCDGLILSLSAQMELTQEQIDTILDALELR